MKLELASRWSKMPRNEKGDIEFTSLGPNGLWTSLLGCFTPEEIVELVNRALYQLEYQAASHAKRGKEERAKAKALREALKAAGKDPKALRIKDELEGK